jgi:type IV pilus assembly protein PilB
MMISEEIRSLIVTRAHTGEIRRVAIEQGMRPLIEDGFDKVRDGETTLAEIARVTA